MALQAENDKLFYDLTSAPFLTCLLWRPHDLAQTASMTLYDVLSTRAFLFTNPQTTQVF